MQNYKWEWKELPEKKAYEKWNNVDYRNATANLIARRLKLNPTQVGLWLKKIKAINLCDIVSKYKDIEIIEGVINI